MSTQQENGSDDSLPEIPMSDTPAVGVTEGESVVGPMKGNSAVPADSPVEPIVMSDAQFQAGPRDEAPVVEMAEEVVRREPEVLKDNPLAEQTHPTSEPFGDKHAKKFDPVELLQLFALPPKQFNELVESLPNVKLDGDDPKLHWLNVLENATGFFHQGGAFQKTLEDEEALWRQSIKNGVDELRAGRPRFGDSTDPSNLLTGERAALKLSASLGLGAITQIPLVHTGIWVSIKAPSEAELLELERRIVTEKTILGRSTNGLIYSNVSVYHANFIINLALQNVYDSSFKDINPQTLKETILLTDLPALIWGLACTIWPNGYPYEQPCSSGIECAHVFKAVLNLSKLLWTNNRALSDVQKRHMAKRGAKVVGIEDIKAYQQLHGYHQFASFTMGEQEVGVELKVPSLNDYVVSGMEWVDAIVNNTDNAFGTQMSDQERNDYIITQSKATGMRQYAHWVDRLILPDEGGIIADGKTIEQSLDMMSTDGALQVDFFDKVGAFIDKTTIALIALPRETCPKCKAPQRDPNQVANPNAKVQHPHLVPINMSQVFFTQLGQRRYKVQVRSLS